MKSKFDQTYIGVLGGLLFPIIGFLIYWTWNFDTLSVSEYFNHLLRLKKLPQVISLSVIMNLAIFYLFIWRKFYYSARGVIGATFFWVLIVLIQKFM